MRRMAAYTESAPVLSKAKFVSIENGLDNAKFTSNSRLLYPHTGNNFAWYRAHSDLDYWTNLHITSKSYHLLLWISLFSEKTFWWTTGVTLLCHDFIHKANGSRNLCVTSYSQVITEQQTKEVIFIINMSRHLLSNLHTCIGSLQSCLLGEFDGIPSRNSCKAVTLAEELLLTT